jgi:FkbM family methyltransferase
MMSAALLPLESWIRRLQTAAPRVSPLSRAVRASLLVPAFGAYWTALRVRARFRGAIGVRCQAVDGSIFECRLPDLVQTYIHLFAIWEPDLTHFIRRRLSAGDTFVDVGANIGYYTVLASKWVGPRGRVVAIEASPRVFQDLRANVDLNRTSDHTRLVNMAASDRVGELEVFAGPEYNIGLTTTVSSRGFPAQAHIPCAPLGDLMSAEEVRAARIVKIDVEGGEPAVLDGMGSFLDQATQEVEILVELSPAWWMDRSRAPSSLLRPLLDRGFHTYALPNSYWPWRYLWPNCVAAPRRISIDTIDRAARLDLVLSRQDTDEL